MGEQIILFQIAGFKKKIYKMNGIICKYKIKLVKGTEKWH